MSLALGRNRIYCVEEQAIKAMAIPPEFTYTNEDDFVQRFVIPLLQRLGFSLVVNYHGRAEFGKDLVFAEVDRFGHVRYHGLQAKYESTISLNGIEDLIRDGRQAFENPFTHPQTGSVERISSFYAVTAGSIGPEASQHYFNSLIKVYSGNARLLQSKDLLVLDRWASAGYRGRMTDLLNGLLIELDYNERHVIPLLIASMNHLLAGTGAWELWRLRMDATSAYLREPFMADRLKVDTILNYWHLAVLCNKEVDLVGQGILGPDNRKNLTEQAIRHLDELRSVGLGIGERVRTVLQELGPLTGV